jgi:hypothetical protein
MGFLYDFVHSHWIVRILVILAALGMLAWSILVLVNHFRQAKAAQDEEKGTGRLPNLAAERSAALQGLVPKTTSGSNDNDTDAAQTALRGMTLGDDPDSAESESASAPAVGTATLAPTAATAPAPADSTVQSTAVVADDPNAVGYGVDVAASTQEAKLPTDLFEKAVRRDIDPAAATQLDLPQSSEAGADNDDHQGDQKTAPLLAKESGRGAVSGDVQAALDKVLQQSAAPPKAKASDQENTQADHSPELVSSPEPVSNLDDDIDESASTVRIQAAQPQQTTTLGDEADVAQNHEAMLQEREPIARQDSSDANGSDTSTSLIDSDATTQLLGDAQQDRSADTSELESSAAISGLGDQLDDQAILDHLDEQRQQAAANTEASRSDDKPAGTESELPAQASASEPATQTELASATEGAPAKEDATTATQAAEEKADKPAEEEPAAQQTAAPPSPEKASALAQVDAMLARLQNAGAQITEPLDAESQADEKTPVSSAHEPTASGDDAAEPAQETEAAQATKPDTPSGDTSPAAESQEAGKDVATPPPTEEPITTPTRRNDIPSWARADTFDDDQDQEPKQSSLFD